MLKIILILLNVLYISEKILIKSLLGIRTVRYSLTYNFYQQGYHNAVVKVGHLQKLQRFITRFMHMDVPIEST